MFTESKSLLRVYFWDPIKTKVVFEFRGTFGALEKKILLREER